MAAISIVSVQLGASLAVTLFAAAYRHLRRAYEPQPCRRCDRRPGHPRAAGTCIAPVRDPCSDRS